MLNTYEHDDADKLTRSVERALPALERLIERAREEGALTIYVNDNLGDWTPNAADATRLAMAGARPDLVEPVAPPEDALFIAKARHTIFYGTPLEYLLAQEDVDRVVLAGQVTEQCILYSALDAYVRHLDVAVPRDAVAHIHEDLAAAALRMMELNMGAQILRAGDGPG
jgi:nicotinamidase-related amidase